MPIFVSGSKVPAPLLSVATFGDIHFLVLSFLWKLCPTPTDILSFIQKKEENISGFGTQLFKPSNYKGLIQAQRNRSAGCHLHQIRSHCSSSHSLAHTHTHSSMLILTHTLHSPIPLLDHTCVCIRFNIRLLVADIFKNFDGRKIGWSDKMKMPGWSSRKFSSSLIFFH